MNDPSIDPLTDTSSNTREFRTEYSGGELRFSIRNNTNDRAFDPFTGMNRGDARGSKVLLFNKEYQDFAFSVDMKLLQCHLPGFQNGGWLGLALRAQDLENYELVWFTPDAAQDFLTAAYIPVAHGICPWWTEAYEQQKKAKAQISIRDWFRVSAIVHGRTMQVYINEQFMFEKKLSYYLVSGKAGMFVGTATDAAFRNPSIIPLGSS
jgi:hypothetical protein